LTGTDALALHTKQMLVHKSSSAVSGKANSECALVHLRDRSAVNGGTSIVAIKSLCAEAEELAPSLGKHGFHRATNLPAPVRSWGTRSRPRIVGSVADEKRRIGCR
jgi:hypothetical protein